MLLVLKNILFTVLLPGPLAVYVPLCIATGSIRGLSWDGNPSQIAALLPLSIGAVIYFWCLWDFAVSTRGTPIPVDAPKQLVVRGLYRIVRNPIYISELVVIAGWALFFQSWAILSYGIMLGMFFHMMVVMVEEPNLKEEFGEAYVRYCRETGRWIPKLGGEEAA